MHLRSRDFAEKPRRSHVRDLESDEEDVGLSATREDAEPPMPMPMPAAKRRKRAPLEIMPFGEWLRAQGYGALED